jgi:SAM-dependent methyltransferase
MSSRINLVKKGIKNPGQAISYVLGQAFPHTRLATLGKPVEIQDDYITFSHGGFASSAGSLADFSAKQYYEVETINQIVENRISNTPVEKSLEIGCGYGRLSPWIARHSASHNCVEPNGEAIDEAKSHYSDIEFYEGLVQEMPFDDGSFQLGVSWTVLHHIPPETIREACEEINRVMSSDGILILAESTRKDNWPTGWGRSVEQYADLLDMNVLETMPKPVEPTFDDGEKVEHHPNDEIIILSEEV